VPYLARIEESTMSKDVRAVLREGSLKLTEAIGGTPHPAINKEKKAKKSGGSTLRSQG
jgi:hypothetical protein